MVVHFGARLGLTKRNSEVDEDGLPLEATSSTRSSLVKRVHLSIHDSVLVVVHGKSVRFAKLSLCSLSAENKLRHACIWLQEWRYFDYVIMVAIFINSVMLAASSTSPEFDESDFSQGIDKVFTAIFCAELIVKVIAQGLIVGDRAYLRSSWNCLDAVVVVTSLADVNISFMRCFKLLRPLRTLGKFKGMRQIVATLAAATSALGNLVAFGTFVFGVFSIIGVNILGDVTWSRCRSTSGPVIEGGIAIWPVVEEERFCGGGYNCEPDGATGLPVCGNLLTVTGPGPQLWNELRHDGDAEFGVMGFHNFGSAMLTVFHVATMENWEDVMHKYMDGFEPNFSIIFFMLMVVIGNLFVLNLVIAILWEKFDECASAVEAESTPSEERKMQEAATSMGWKGQLEAHLDLASKEQVVTCFKAWCSHWEAEKLRRLEEAFTSLPQLMIFVNNYEQNEGRDDMSRQESPSPSLSSQRCALQVRLKSIIESKVFAIFIFLMILANSVILAMSGHPPLSDTTQRVVSSLNVFFTIAFTLEIILKAVAYGASAFRSDHWNQFDLFIVISSLVELALGDQGGSAISVLRLCRLLRIFKLAKNILSLRILLEVLWRSMFSLANICCVALLMIYILMLTGMTFFARNLPPEGSSRGERPRLNFDDPLWAFTTVFVIFTGNDWNEMMVETGYLCGSFAVAISYYLVCLFIGNIVILPLFMAILAGSFSRAREDLFNECVAELKNKQVANPERFNKCLQEHTSQAERAIKEKQIKQDQWYDDQELNHALLVLLRPIRVKCHKIVTNTKFEWFIMSMIIISSVLLAIDSPYLDPKGTTKLVLSTFDLIFWFIFFLEATAKIFAFGFVGGPGAYLKNGWNILDCTVVLLATTDIMLTYGGSGADLSGFRVLRALRALRPLRLISRNEGLKYLVKGLLQSIPGLADTLAVALLFFFIFATLGLNFFKGRMSYCEGSEVEVIDKKECEANGGMWTRPDVHFDNIFAAFLALFQVAAGASWDQIMMQAVDAVGVDMQPQEDANKVQGILFFVGFVVAGSFMILNLFVGVIVDELQASKREDHHGNAFVTEDERTWVEMQSLLLGRVRLKQRPNWDHYRSMYKWGPQMAAGREAALRFCQHRRFEVFMSICIVINTLAMTLRHSDMSEDFEKAMVYISLSFTAIFTLEAVVKIIGLGKLYFKDGWNKFDFVLVTGALGFLVADSLVPGLGEKYGFLALVMRTFRICRVLRMVRAAKGLQMLFKTLFAVIPALGNCSCLLGLMFFIYACLGNAMFGRVLWSDAMSDHLNFMTFGSSFFAWTVMSTGSAWENLIWACSSARPGCVESQTYEDLIRDGPRECGTPAGVFIFLSYQIFIALIVMNLFVGVVLETFSGASASSSFEGIKDQVKELYDKWSEKKPNGKRLMKLDDACDILLSIEPPFGCADLKTELNDDHVVGQRDFLKIMLGEFYVRLWDGKVHLHDLMLFCCRRACAWVTSPAPLNGVLISQAALVLNRMSMVTFSEKVLLDFKAQFPEFGDSPGLRKHGGTFHDSTFYPNHEYAARYIQAVVKAKKEFGKHGNVAKGLVKVPQYSTHQVLAQHSAVSGSSLPSARTVSGSSLPSVPGAPPKVPNPKLPYGQSQEYSLASSPSHGPRSGPPKTRRETDEAVVGKGSNTNLNFESLSLPELQLVDQRVEEIKQSLQREMQRKSPQRSRGHGERGNAVSAISLSPDAKSGYGAEPYRSPAVKSNPNVVPGQKSREKDTSWQHPGPRPGKEQPSTANDHVLMGPITHQGDFHLNFDIRPPKKPHTNRVDSDDTDDSKIEVMLFDSSVWKQAKVTAQKRIQEENGKSCTSPSNGIATPRLAEALRPGSGDIDLPIAENRSPVISIPRSMRSGGGDLETPRTGNHLSSATPRSMRAGLDTPSECLVGPLGSPRSNLALREVISNDNWPLSARSEKNRSTLGGSPS